jgi:hypothetical protein
LLLQLQLLLLLLSLLLLTRVLRLWLHLLLMLWGKSPPPIRGGERRPRVDLGTGSGVWGRLARPRWDGCPPRMLLLLLMLLKLMLL